MAFEFGDKILHKGRVAVYLHKSDRNESLHWVSVYGDEFNADTTWAETNEISHFDQVSDYQTELTRNVRDKMILIFGQLMALQYGCDSNTGHALESIEMQFERLIKQLFKDYE